MERRHFLRTVGMAGLTAAAFPNILRAQNANEKINVGLIGCGGISYGKIDCLFNVPNTQCVAICDIDDNRIGDMKKFFAERNQPEPKVYKDYRKLLESKDIQAVIITTPDHWHCLQMTDACAAGKDVYVEKPMANSMAECDAMIAAAKRHNRVVQVGQQQRSSQMWNTAMECVNSGYLGAVPRVNIWANFDYASVRGKEDDRNPPEGVDFDMWLGPAPKRSFNYKRFHGIWRMYWDYGGGLMTDWGVHLIDMALGAMKYADMPKSVTAMGGNLAYPDSVNETFDTMSVNYDCGDFQIVWSNSAIQQGPWFRHYGLAFHGEKGILLVNRDGMEVLPHAGKSEKITVSPSNNEDFDHMQNFIDCIRGRNFQTACPVENGALVAKYAHMGNIAARTGEILRYDARTNSFNIPAADKLMKSEYRSPWKFPNV